MSVIGTTLKQPRVFSHDAIALADLPDGVHKPIDTVSIVDYTGQPLTYPDTTIGSGFLVGEIYTAVSSIDPGAKYCSFEVVVSAVDANGGIISVSFTSPSCDSTSSTQINDEELFDVVWSPKQSQQWNEPGASSANKLLNVNLGSNTPWDYSCPISPVIQQLDEPSYFRQQATYRQKDIIRYTCDDTCTWETYAPGASLYIGYDLESLTVIMESGKKVTWSNIPAGSFMPVSVLTVCEAIAAGPVGDVPNAEALKTLILALF